MKFPKHFIYALLATSFTLKTGPMTGAEDSHLKEIWNFDNADIQLVIKRVSEVTGKNFVLDPRVQGKVTVISQQPLSPEEAYQVLLSVLRVHGFKAVEADNVIKVFPQDSANRDTGQIANKPLQNIDKQVVKALPLKFLPSTEIVASIREMVPPTSQLMAVNSSNHVIIADTESNISKVEKVISQVDTRLNQMVEIVEVKHAAAAEVVNTLTSLLRERGGAIRYPITFAADERTNSVLVSGGSAEQRAYVTKVIRQLDSPTNNNANSEVIYLKYVQASDIAPIIATFLEESLRSSKDQREREESKTQSSANAIATASSPQDTPFPENHLKALKQYSESGGTQGSLFNINENRPKSGIVNRFVQWEESTNSLIVKASPSIMRAIKSIIAKLDIRRPQVIIEVVIAEINLNRLEEYGVEWNISPNAADKFGTRLNNRSPNLSNIVGNFSAGTVSELGSGISVGVFRHGDLRALLAALSTDSSANVLSTPTLVTLDNQTALIKVGEKVPFAIGQTNNQNTGGNPFTSYDREEVGLSLTIKPQIVNRDEIKLQIENILSNVIPGSANADTGFNKTTSERTIVTNVLVHEGKILVLGGLIQDDWVETVNKVPFLGSIPGLGELFKSNTKKLVKKNLMIFLRPKIISDDVAGVRISTSKYDQTREAQIESYNILNHPFVNEPVTAPPLSQNDFYPNNPYPENQKTEVILPPPFE